MPTREATRLDSLLDAYSDQAEIIECARVLSIQWLHDHPEDELAAHMVLLLS